MKKLLLITFLSTTLLWTINILVYYLFNYPNEFDLLKIVKEYVEWQSLLFTYSALIFVSIIASLLFFKKQTFLKIFCKIMIYINVAGMLFMSLNGVIRFIENKKSYDEFLNEYRKDAANDIKNDAVKTFGYGFPLPPINTTQEIVKIKTDSILKKYSLTIKNLGCTIMPELTKASEEYEKITAVYLTKRNGTGWKIKMLKKIQKINKNNR